MLESSQESEDLLISMKLFSLTNKTLTNVFTFSNFLLKSNINISTLSNEKAYNIYILAITQHVAKII